MGQVVLDYCGPASPSRVARWGIWLMVGSFVCALPVLVLAALSSLDIGGLPHFSIGRFDDQNLLHIGIQTALLGVGLSGAAIVLGPSRWVSVLCAVANLAAFVVGPQFVCA